MLRWIVSLAIVCSVSAAMGLGHIIPVAATAQSMWLALSALSGVLLICSFDAFETQAASADIEEDN